MRTNEALPFYAGPMRISRIGCDTPGRSRHFSGPIAMVAKQSIAEGTGSLLREYRLPSDELKEWTPYRVSHMATDLNSRSGWVL